MPTEELSKTHQALDRYLKIEVYKIDSIIDDDGNTEDQYKLKYRKLNLYEQNSLGIDVVIIDPDRYVIPRTDTGNLALKAVFNIIKYNEDGTVNYRELVKDPVYCNLTYNEDELGKIYLKGCLRVGVDVTKVACDLKMELTVYNKVTKNYVTLPEELDLEVLPSLHSIHNKTSYNNDLVYILNHPCVTSSNYTYDKDIKYEDEDVLSMKGIKEILNVVMDELAEAKEVVKLYKPIVLTIKPGVGRDRFLLSDDSIEIDDSIGSEIKLTLKESIASAFLSTITPVGKEYIDEEKQGYVSTVSSFARLQFYIKKVEKNSITLQCFNSEQIIEPVFNEITQEYEDQITMDVGVINLDELPKIYMTVNILCITVPNVKENPNG